MACTPDCERRIRWNANGADGVVAIDYTDSRNNHLRAFAIDDESQGNQRILVEDVVMVVEGRQHKNFQESLLLENLAALVPSRTDMDWHPEKVD